MKPRGHSPTRLIDGALAGRIAEDALAQAENYDDGARAVGHRAATRDGHGIPIASLIDYLTERARERGRPCLVRCADGQRRHPREARESEVWYAAARAALVGHPLWEALGILAELWPGAIPPAIVTDAIYEQAEADRERAEDRYNEYLRGREERDRERRDAIGAGLRAARDAGRHIGRPGATFDGAMVQALRAAGLSIRVIAERLNVSRSTVGRFVKLENPAAKAVGENCVNNPVDCPF